MLFANIPTYNLLSFVLKMKQFTRRLYVVALIFILGSVVSFGQNHWQPVSSALDPFYQVCNLNDTLYGLSKAGNHWQISLFENGIWKKFPPIKLANQEEGIRIQKLKGELYALTSNRFLRFSTGKWGVVTTSAFLNMAAYNGKIVLYGSFNSIFGESCSGLGYWDGTNGGALRGVGGQMATITGWVEKMVLIDNELFFLGNISNTNLGTTLSNTAIWNDTTWRQAFTHLPERPDAKDVIKWNGDYYFSLAPTSSNATGVYKLVGLSLQPVVTLDTGLIMGGYGVDDLAVFNNKIFASARVVQYYLDPWGNPQSTWRKTLLNYDGVKWRESGDTLCQPTTSHNELVLFNGELYANNLPCLKGKPYVGKLASSSAEAILAIMDIRDTMCDNESVYRFIPTLVEVTNNTNTNLYYSSKLGDVSIPLSDSSVSTIKLHSDIPYYHSSQCADSVITVNTVSKKTHQAYFFVTPPVSAVDLSVSIAAQTGWRARHGFYDDYFFVVKNQGTDTVSSAILELNHPAASIWHAGSLTPTIVDSTKLTFNLPDLAPGELITVVSKIHNTTALKLADTITFLAGVLVPDDIESTNNLSRLNQYVVSAYDPNNKLVNREGIAQWRGELIYHINFQNLGNDTAYRVVVIDSLHHDLIPETFRLLASSHNLDIQIQNGVIQFIFDDILLPDSSANALGSKGFVQYSIDMKGGLAKNDTITNQAHIYFDFQPAVITNIAKTFITQLTPSIEPSPDPELFKPKDKWVIYPNPSAGIFNVYTEIDRSYEIFDYLGELVATGVFHANELDAQIDLTSFADGIYLLIEEKGSLTKLIISR